ncbi:hypothetical protein FRB90_004611, partial [Tulasnella sp. 427]
MLPQTPYNLLSRVYRVVDTLGNYVDQLVPEIFVELPDDPPYFVAVLNSWIICLSKSAAEIEPKFKYFKPSITQSELIKRVQYKMLKLPDRSNVLCLGNRIPDERDDNSMERVVSYAINTNVEKLKDRVWRQLLERIGEGPMIHILSTCSIFEPVGNDCFVQLCGAPLSDLLPSNNIRGAKRAQATEAAEGPPEKRQRAETGAILPPKKIINTPADIPIARSRIFYSRPQLVARNKVRLGLPGSHALNKVQPDRTAQDTPESHQKKLEAAARHLSKYIFPQQYKLKSVFTCAKDSKAPNPFPSFEDREVEIL